MNLGRLPEHAISLRQGATHMLIQINEGRFGSRPEIARVKRGRDDHCSPPPAQIRAGGIPAHGSYLGCMTAKRLSGYG